MDRRRAASVHDVMGAGFPFRDFLVARTYEPRADAAAMLVARALADRMHGGNASVLAERLRVPVVVVPRQVGVDLTGLRSIVCGVRDPRDTTSVVAAGALADALDLQLVLVHVGDGAFGAATSQDEGGVRRLLGDVASRAGRRAPGAACLRVIDGAVGETLCRAGVDERAALVAVTAARRRPFASALLGCVARHVTRHADRPVLVCPRQPEPALRLGARRP